MIVRVVVGVVLGAIGVVWFLQGIGTVGGSAMSGHVFWSFAGAVLILIGVRVLLRARRHRVSDTTRS